MGTNYYVMGPEGKRLPGVDSDDTGLLHVGKSSAGWVFCFRAHRNLDSPILSTEDWRRAIDGLVVRGPCSLFDEYGNRVDVDEFWQKVEKKKSPPDGRRGADDRNDRHSYADSEGNDFILREFC